MFQYVIDLIKGLIAREPARLIAYGSALAVAGAGALANLLGIALPADVIAGVAAIGGFIVTELIRRFVYAPATVAEILAD